MSALNYVMTSDFALQILGRLEDHGVTACVGGGWAVDALLGKQNRQHADLDLWVEAAQTHQLLSGLAAAGIDSVLPWPGDRPWNFVLHDGGHLRVDLHFYEPLSPTTWHYGSMHDSTRFPSAALQGRGVIGGAPVRCESPEWSMSCHTGYPPRDIDRHDVALLRTRFGLAVPEAFR